MGSLPHIATVVFRLGYVKLRSIDPYWDSISLAYGLTGLKPPFKKWVWKIDINENTWKIWVLTFYLVWMSTLMFVAFPISGFSAGWYILLNPFTLIFDSLNVSVSIYYFWKLIFSALITHNVTFSFIDHISVFCESIWTLFLVLPPAIW